MLTVDQFDNRYLVSFSNVSKLNVLNSNEIESELSALASKEDSNLTLNFSGVKFIDSSGFETLLKVHKTSILSNSNVNLINLSDELMELFQLVELDSVLQIN
jgi:anti-anti-sigma factor